PWRRAGWRPSGSSLSSSRGRTRPARRHGRTHWCCRPSWWRCWAGSSGPWRQPASAPAWPGSEKRPNPHRLRPPSAGRYVHAWVSGRAAPAGSPPEALLLRRAGATAPHPVAPWLTPVAYLVVIILLAGMAALAYLSVTRGPDRADGGRLLTV